MVHGESARVHVLYVGGEMAMMPLPENRGLAPQALATIENRLRGIVSELPQIELTFESLGEPLDSANVQPKHWVAMAERIERVYDFFDGFVILHGKDTLSYSSSALAFMFENLAKPVVFTDSQLPLSDPKSDARTNFGNAVRVAGYMACGLPCIPEVLIVFGSKLLRGCRAVQISERDFDAFDSPNCPPIGRIGFDIDVDDSLVREMPAAGKTFRIRTELNSRVLALSLFPGTSEELLNTVFNGSSADAVILQTYGLGNVPTDPGFCEAVKAFIAAGKTVVTMPARHDQTEIDPYSAAAELLKLGVIPAVDMTAPAVLAKLMLALTTDSTDVARRMQQDQRGELTYRNLISLVDEQKLSASLDDVYFEIRDAIALGRINLYELSPRKFEEFIASMYANHGYRVELTKQTRDGGYDIIAIRENPMGLDLRLVIECKRNRPDRPVELSVVRALWGVVADPANHFDRGIVATTSRLSRDAETLIRSHLWRLDKLEFNQILSHAGFVSKGGFWVPER